MNTCHSLKKSRSTRFAALAFAGMTMVIPAINPASAAIAIGPDAENYVSSTTTATNTISTFTVASGSDRKLVLAASWENASSTISATWNGTESFSVAENSAGGRNSAILYLDNPTPGTGNIDITFGGNTGSRVGVVSLTGAADGVAVTSTATGLSGSLNTTVDGSFVSGVYTTNNNPTITGPPATTDRGQFRLRRLRCE